MLAAEDMLARNWARVPKLDFFIFPPIGKTQAVVNHLPAGRLLQPDHEVKAFFYQGACDFREGGAVTLSVLPLICPSAGR
jgi:hypothetical protein